MVEIAFLPLAYESDEGQDYSLTTARLQYNIRAALEPGEPDSLGSNPDFPT